jgi:MtN3 and saliva related transmembrane protein
MTDVVSTLGASATAYSLAAGTALLLQVRTMLRRRSSQDVSLTFLVTTSGGYLIWLLYGLGIGSMPLIISDAVGLVCSLLAVAVAFHLRVRLHRPGPAVS